MSGDLPSVYSIDARLRESRGTAAQTFFDDELALLLEWPNVVDPAFLAPLRGEALLRVWLYANHPPESLGCALSPGFVTLARVPRSDGSAAPPAALADENDRAAWSYAAQRLAEFHAADGLIALASPVRETALAVPFTLDPTAPTAGARDAAGNVIQAWSAAVGALETEFGGSFRFRIGARLDRAETESISGGSFGLPVWLARARHEGRLGHYPTLGLLATGTVQGRQVGVADRLSAKAALAGRLGALLAAPGNGGRSETLVLPTGLPVAEAAARVAAALTDRGYSHATPRVVLASLRRLNEAVHRATIPLDVAARRLATCEMMLAKLSGQSSALLEEAWTWVAIIGRALANHRGAPGSGKPLIDGRASLQGTLDEASAIVALTDRGQLEEAQRRGEVLLGRVTALFGEERLHCEMIASGVLGGQPLLHRAVAGEHCAERSLALLERALACTRELEDPDEIARDVTQIALWHALLQPAETARACLRAEAEIAPLPPDSSAVSRGYLERARWLGAYRHHLLTGGVPDHLFEDWPLPSPEIGERGWLRATARKYRGTLRAARGQTEIAMEDFAAACEAMFASDAVILRFIGATAALQATESLADLRRPAAFSHRRAASAIFADLITGAPFLVSRDWQARCQVAAAGAKPHPQLYCVY